MYKLVGPQLRCITKTRQLLTIRAKSSHAQSDSGNFIVAKQELLSIDNHKLLGNRKFNYQRLIVRPEMLDDHDATRWTRVSRQSGKTRRPRSAAALRVEERLQDPGMTPFDALKAALVNGSVDPATIEVCLEHQSQRLQSLPQSQVSDYVRKYPLASIVIGHLLQNNDAGSASSCPSASPSTG